MLPAVEIRDVWKRFIVRHNRADSLKSKVMGVFYERYREQSEEFWALRGIDLTVAPGEALGLIGPNGSGKSTLLRLIARTLVPTRGEIIIPGRVAPMIELGVGFHPELTGQENVYLSASLYGLSHDDIDQLYPEIVAFSELEHFINVPVKNYSTGMYARLGFATAMSLNPDTLLIDEVLAVGDERFQKKCIDRMLRLRQQDKTIIFVSHDPHAIELLCDRACFLFQGGIVELGTVEHVLARYRREAEAASA